MNDQMICDPSHVVIHLTRRRPGCDLFAPLPPDCGLTDGLEALQRVGDADEVLPVVHAAVGEVVASLLARGGEVRRAVDQPEALFRIQQDDALKEAEEMVAVGSTQPQNRGEARLGGFGVHLSCAPRSCSR